MEFDTDINDQSQQYLIAPDVLLLKDRSVPGSTIDSQPIYHLTQDITSDKQTYSSVLLERIGSNGSPRSSTEIMQKTPLFYLVHPVNASYRSDIPASYYMTSASHGMIGNIRFRTIESFVRRREFQAFVSANRGAADVPLFDKDNEQLVFKAKASWKDSRYKWTNSASRQLAVEDTKDDQKKLVITVSMEGRMRDALVAVWILRIWHETAETRQMKRQGMLKPTTVRLDAEYSDLDIIFSSRRHDTASSTFSISE